MIKLKSLIAEIANIPPIGEYNFVGFHRQRRERSQYDDRFIVGNGYGASHFREILDSLYNKDKLEAIKHGWLEYEWNEYANEYDNMEKTIADWLNNKGYRWIFVTENKPIGVSVYGNYIYKVYFKKGDIIHIFDDPLGADDVAYAYLYHISNPPKFEPYN